MALVGWMYGLHVETLSPHKGLSRDLVEHILDHSLPGKIVVVTDKPHNLLSSTRKQWINLIRKTDIERARTLDAERIQDLSNQLRWMQRLRFTAKQPTDFLEADITFATAEHLVLHAPGCVNIYFTFDIPRESLHIITSWMPRRGLVVIYGQD
jgi:hypothetical protein